MSLLFHAMLPLPFCFLIIIGWAASIYFVIRGFSSLKKSEDKLRLLLISSALLLVCGGVNYLLFNLQNQIFAFLEGKGIFAFPFGQLFLFPTLFFFDTRDLFAYEIFLMFGILFNLIGMIGFVNYLNAKLFTKEK